MSARLFAIGDLHLSFAKPKPMDIFGPAWINHAERMAEAWRRTVRPDDVVLVAGDHSWGLRLEEAQPDLDFIASLPGQKILTKGNHDYWWPDGAGRLRALERPGLWFIREEPISAGGYLVTGARWWDSPECEWGEAIEAAATAKGGGGKAEGPRRGVPDPESLRVREMDRLRRRLARLGNAAETRGARGARVCLLHFPPLPASGEPSSLTRLMDEFEVDWCVFGHIHGTRAGGMPPGARMRIHRTEYALCSLDQIGFAPVMLHGGGAT